MPKLKLDPQYAQKVTAHEDIEMLLDVYTHVDEQEAKDAFNKISFMGGRSSRDSTRVSPDESIRRILRELDPEALALVGPILEGVAKMLEGLRGRTEKPSVPLH